AGIGFFAAGLAAFAGLCAGFLTTTFFGLAFFAGFAGFLAAALPFAGACFFVAILLFFFNYVQA
ncbi:MAG TPA: hypothetical protein VKH37_08050, partial [Ferruginibacter sp.]|nr:hypothetical protein [Ferruginibacter sp.]